MTFPDYLAAHPDATVQAAREWLHGRAGGPRTLRDALDDLDASGAPGVASLAVREAWGEWREMARAGNFWESEIFSPELLRTVR